jgi:hypothetical protein
MAPLVFGMVDAGGDGAGQPLGRTVAPQPCGADQRSARRAALAIRSVTARTGAALGLAQIDGAALRDLCGGDAGGQGGGCGGLRDRAELRGRGRGDRRIGGAGIGDAPDRPAPVIRDIERPVRPHGQPRRAMDRAARFLVRPGETVGEADPWPVGLAVLQRLEDDEIAVLRRGGAVPRSVEGDEGALCIGGGEAGPYRSARHWGPDARGRRRRGASCLRRSLSLAAVAAIFGGQHVAVLESVIIAGGPAEIGALEGGIEDFGGAFDALFDGVEFGPVLGELVAAMLDAEDAACRVEAEPAGVAQARGPACGGRKLTDLVRAIGPQAAARRCLGAGVAPLAPGWRLGLSQVLLADPEFTMRLPAASMAKGCIGWSPPRAGRTAR